MNKIVRNFFDEVFAIIQISSATEKCWETESVFVALEHGRLDIVSLSDPLHIPVPGLPENLNQVSPRKLKKRGIGSQEGRTALMHAIAHIEFNAINLALDAAYRFRDMPEAYYRDWIFVAADEARHFSLVSEYLNRQDCQYGDFPVHAGLWDMANHTQSDVLARMALIPRVLEARGLDVTPPMIKRLGNAGDDYAVSILQTIYDDEIEHVKLGSKWYKFLCAQRGLQPGPAFVDLVGVYLHGDLKGPFNSAARRQAGFDDYEISYLEALK